MKEEYEKNLLRLAFYLIRGNTEHNFDMERYFVNQGCGTSACAMGHVPIIFEDLDENDYYGITGFCAKKYIKLAEEKFGIQEDDKLIYSWLFSSAWKKCDNTTDGAGKRILWFLYRGIPFDNKKILNEFVRAGNVNLKYMHMETEEIIGEENMADFEEVQEEMEDKINA